jgi:hypothetical protein
MLQQIVRVDFFQMQLKFAARDPGQVPADRRSDGLSSMLRQTVRSFIDLRRKPGSFAIPPAQIKTGVRACAVVTEGGKNDPWPR